MKVFVILFLLASYFPYTQILPLSTYTQPYAFLLSGIIFGVVGWNQVKHLRQIDGLALGLLFVLGVVLFVLTCLPSPQMQEFKYLLMYIAPLMFATNYIYIHKHHRKLAKKLTERSILLWIFVGAVQLLVDPTFASFTVGEWQGSAQVVVDSGRGVIGLAPEPTHFGFHMILMGCILLLMDGNKYLVLASIASALLLAQSSSVLLVLMLGTSLALLTRPLLLVVFFGLVGLAVIGFEYSLFVNAGVDSRIVYLLTQFAKDPMAILSLDYSLNARLGGLIAATIDSFQNWFLPNGITYSSWEDRSILILNKFPWLFGLSSSGWPSGYLIVISQIGLFGVFTFFVTINRFYSVSTSLTQKVLLLSGFSIFFFQYYMSAPAFGIIYGAIAARSLRTVGTHKKRDLAG